MWIRKAFVGILVVSAIALALCLPGPRKAAEALAAQEDSAAQAPEPAPPEGQTYIGMKACSACHFEQFLVWRQDKHAQAFTNLPAKYKTDASCLKCHTTGFGEPTGYKTAADADLAAVSCEVCHGPGSKHQEICKPFATAKTLSPQQEKLARDSIYKVQPSNACIECHTAKAHKAHLKYDK